MVVSPFGIITMSFRVIAINTAFLGIDKSFFSLLAAFALSLPDMFEYSDAVFLLFINVLPYYLLTQVTSTLLSRIFAAVITNSLSSNFSPFTNQ